MPQKIQFGCALTNFFGEEIEEDDPRGLPSALQSELRRVLVAAQAQDLLAQLEPWLKPKRKLTVGDVACRGLNAGVDQNERLDPKEHIARWELMRKIIAAEKSMTPLQLDSEEIATIKKAIAKAGFLPWVAGQAMAILEGRHG